MWRKIVADLDGEQIMLRHASRNLKNDHFLILLSLEHPLARLFKNAVSLFSPTNKT
jgi:hypothetical protein